MRRKCTATVYDQNGKVIKTYKGMLDVEVNDSGNKVKIYIDGKCVVITNAIVIVEDDK